MGIADEEAKIMEELKKLSGEEVIEQTPPEEIIQDIQQEYQEDESEQESDYEEEDDMENPESDSEFAEEDEVNDEEEEDSEEVEEDVKPGAAMRHKIKAEKEARERAERELQELRERMARLEGRAEASQQPQQEEPQEEIPDPDYEPEKYALWKAQKLEEKMQVMEQQQARLSAQQQWHDMESEYIQNNPSYTDAKQFLIKREAERIKAQYPQLTDSQINSHLKSLEYETVGQAARAGMDPIKYIEYLAFQGGYKAAEKSEKVENPVKKKSNIDKIKKNARKSASLIGSSSQGEGERRTAEQLLAMSMQEIDKMGRDKYEKQLMRLATKG